MSGLKASAWEPKRESNPMWACKLGPMSCFCVQSAAGFNQENQKQQIFIGGEDPPSVQVLPAESDRANMPPVHHVKTFGKEPASSSSFKEERKAKQPPKSWKRRAGSGAGESLDWLNNVISILWPKVSGAVADQVRNEILPKVKEQLPSLLQGISLTKFTLGDTPPEFSDINVCEMKLPDKGRRGLEITLSLTLESDLDIELSFGHNLATLGVKKLTINGDLAVRLEPLLDKEPLVGGVVVFFYDHPTVNLSFTGLGAFAQQADLHSLIRGQIDKQITEAIVLPNVVFKELGTEEQGIDLAQLRRPSPMGVLRATAISGKGLTGADFHLFSEKTSDPYVSMKLSDQHWKSAVVKVTCDPVWPKGTSHDFLVYDQNQQIRIDVFDEDWGPKQDDHIGRAEPMSIDEAMQSSEKDMDLFDPEDSLQDGAEVHKAGTLKMRFEWFKLSTVGPDEVRKSLRTNPQDSDHYVVEVKVDEVYMPALLGHAAGLRATVDDQTQESKAIAHNPDEAVFAVKQARNRVAKRCFKASKAVPEIAYVTGLAAADVEELDPAKAAVTKKNSWMQKRVKSNLAEDDATDKTPVILALEYVLRFVVPLKALEKGVAKLVLFDAKKRTLGTASVPLLPDAGKSCEFKMLPFENPNGHKVSADIAVSILGMRRAPFEKKQSHVSGQAHLERLHMSRANARSSHLGGSMRASSLATAGSLDWMNEVLDKIWPNLDRYVASVVKADVERQVNEKMPMMDVVIEEFCLGSKPPILGPITVRELKTPDGQKILEVTLGVTLESETTVKIKTRVATLGIEHISFHGKVCCRIQPLLEKVPVLGGIVVYFLDPPKIDFKFLGAAKIVEQAGLITLIQRQLEEVVASKMVLPNVIGVPIGKEEDGVDRAHLNCPPPLGGLRVTALRARDLKASDINLLSQNTSDPYVKIKFGDAEWQSPTVKANLNPVWDRGEVSHYFLVYAMDQGIRLLLYDEDKFSKHDVIGRCKKILVKDALNLSETDIQIYDPGDETGTLDKTKTAGFLQMRFQWVDFTPLGELGPTQTLVEVKVDEVHLPAAVGSEAAFRASWCGSRPQTRITPVRRPMQKTKPIIKAVDIEFEGMVKRCAEKGFSVEDIANITKKTREDIENILSAGGSSSSGASPTSAATEETAVQQTVYMLEMEHVLRFLVPTREVKKNGSKVKLALENAQGKIIAEANVRLADVLAKGSSQGGFPPAPLEFDVVGGKRKDKGLNWKVKVEVQVSVRGFEKVEGDDPLPDGVLDSLNAKRRVLDRLACCSGICGRG